MRQRELRESKHLQDVAPEGTLDQVEIDVRKVLLHGLFARVVHEDVELPELLQVLVDDLLCVLKVLKVERDG